MHQRKVKSSVPKSPTLQQVLDHPVLREMLRAQMKARRCEEFLAFYFSVEEYRQIQDPVRQSEEAQRMYSRYLTSESSYEINAEHHEKKAISHQLLAPTPHLFDKLQQSVWIQIQDESFKLFTESTQFKMVCHRSPPCYHCHQSQSYAWPPQYDLFHSLTDSLTHSLTHSLTRLLTHSTNG
jgi:hypothetical protein